MFSRAYTIKGQGVASAHDELVELVQTSLSDKFTLSENKLIAADITHYHTVNFRYFLTRPFVGRNGTTVGYVHFLPETMDESLHLIGPVKQIFYKYLITFYKGMDRLVVVNPYFIDRLAAYGIDRNKITYIPNFVDEKTFHPLPPARRTELRREYGLDPDKFTVVCGGQLQRRKGVFDFVQCARDLPDIQFLWAGGFSFGRMTDGYEEISRMLENPPANAFFPGIIDRDKMNGIYNLADVLFLPSYDELFPMIILEAMNCGLPLLLRDIDLYKNILFDFYQRAGDVPGFERELTRLRDDPGYYQQAAARSQAGRQFYNREHVLSLWDTFYSGLVTEKKTAQARLKHHR
ncbi:MAG: glycosyltransferase family 4 protein [Clostridiales bacterium]|nr:glycosyltransferase family 4 protein [Clostridiales bacterium]